MGRAASVARYKRFTSSSPIARQLPFVREPSAVHRSYSLPLLSQLGSLFRFSSLERVILLAFAPMLLRDSRRSSFLP
jgi:hypothetical protein